MAEAGRGAAGDGQAQDDRQRDDRVLAAGCLLWRRDGAGRVLLAAVHRPKYDDWSFPKGKLEPGESHEAAAVREVLEETGFRCELGAPLPSTAYTTADGRPKTVRYWAAQAVAGEFAPNSEVDVLVWLPPGEVRGLLSHERDTTLVDAFDTVRALTRPGPYHASE